MMNNVHVVTLISSGEVKLELDETFVFADIEDAKDKLRELYKYVKKDVQHYPIVVDDFDETYFEVQIEDDYDTVFHGEVDTFEVQQEEITNEKVYYCSSIC